MCGDKRNKAAMKILDGWKIQVLVGDAEDCEEHMQILRLAEKMGAETSLHVDVDGPLAEGYFNVYIAGEDDEEGKYPTVDLYDSLWVREVYEKDMLMPLSPYAHFSVEASSTTLLPSHLCSQFPNEVSSFMQGHSLGPEYMAFWRAFQDHHGSKYATVPVQHMMIWYLLCLKTTPVTLCTSLQSALSILYMSLHQKLPSVDQLYSYILSEHSWLALIYQDHIHNAVQAFHASYLKYGDSRKAHLPSTQLPSILLIDYVEVARCFLSGTIDAESIGNWLLVHEYSLTCRYTDIKKEVASVLSAYGVRGNDAPVLVLEDDLEIGKLPLVERVQSKNVDPMKRFGGVPTVQDRGEIVVGKRLKRRHRPVKVRPVS